MNYEPHEYANIFPMIDDIAFDELKRDIQENGLLQPIVLFENKILDGRNRYKACTELGIEPTFEEYTGNTPLLYVLSLNLKRRHLNESQRAEIAHKLSNMPSGYRSDRPPANLPKVQSREDVAKLFNVSVRLIQDAARIQREVPEKIEEIKQGKITIHEVINNMKKEAKLKEINAIRAEVAKENSRKQKTLVDKKYDVIVIDPPWEYQGGSEAYDSEAFRGTTPYPTMSIEEIKKIPIPASDDCVLWLWTTQKHLPYAFEVMEAYGFEYKVTLTWVKNKIGIGRWLRSQTEFCLMGVRGKPIINLTNQSTALSADVREHSRKPDEFYTMVDTLCPGFKLDYFAREQRENWETYGIEDKKFNGVNNDK